MNSVQAATTAEITSVSCAGTRAGQIDTRGFPCIAWPSVWGLCFKAQPNVSSQLARGREIGQGTSMQIADQGCEAHTAGMHGQLSEHQGSGSVDTPWTACGGWLQAGS